MYYVPEGTKECGFYECKKCGNRFLSLQTMQRIPCPDCAMDIDYEIGPDESMEDVMDGGAHREAGWRGRDRKNGRTLKPGSHRR